MLESLSFVGSNEQHVEVILDIVLCAKQDIPLPNIEVRIMQRLKMHALDLSEAKSQSVCSDKR